METDDSPPPLVYISDDDESQGFSLPAFKVITEEERKVHYDAQTRGLRNFWEIHRRVDQLMMEKIVDEQKKLILKTLLDTPTSTPGPTEND